MAARKRAIDAPRATPWRDRAPPGGPLEVRERLLAMTALDGVLLLLLSSSRSGGSGAGSCARPSGSQGSCWQPCWWRAGPSPLAACSRRAAARARSSRACLAVGLALAVFLAVRLLGALVARVTAPIFLRPSIGSPGWGSGWPRARRCSGSGWRRCCASRPRPSRAKDRGVAGRAAAAGGRHPHRRCGAAARRRPRTRSDPMPGRISDDAIRAIRERASLSRGRIRRRGAPPRGTAPSACARSTPRRRRRSTSASRTASITASAAARAATSSSSS